MQLWRDKHPCSPADTSITELFNAYTSRDPGCPEYNNLSMLHRVLHADKERSAFSAGLGLRNRVVLIWGGVQGDAPWELT